MDQKLEGSILSRSGRVQQHAFLKLKAGLSMWLRRRWAKLSIDPDGIARREDTFPGSLASS